MKTCFTVLLLSFTMACSVNTLTNSGSSPAESRKKSNEPVNCDKPYSLEVVENKDGKTREVNLVQDDAVRESVNITTGRELNGLSKAEKTSKGFDITIEHGTRMYYDRRFSFACKKDGFYLTEIKVESFDKNKPEKFSNKTTKVDPHLSLKKFNLDSYLKN